MKIEKIIVTLSMIGLMCLSTSSVIAGSDGRAHNVADFNHDGMVTSEELVIYVQMNFLKMDKNNDGMLDDKEAAEFEEEFGIEEG